MIHNNGNAQVLLGAAGIKEIYTMSLSADKIDIVCFSSAYAGVIGDFFDKTYAPKLLRSKTITREILPDTAENRKDALQKDQKKNQVAFMPIKQKSESDLLIFAKRAAMISYNQKTPFALIIEDADMVANLQNQFDSLWGSLKK